MWPSLENLLYSLIDVENAIYAPFAEFLVQIICFVVCGALVMLPFIIIYKVVEIISEGVK